MDNELYKNKYRIKTTRLKNYDYAQDGFYFVTICTKDRELIFGDVKKNKMILNNIGQLAEKYWLEIPMHFNNTRLDEFIVMPNHLHGILVIDNVINGKNVRGNSDENVRNGKNVRGRIRVRGRDEACLVSTDGEITTNAVIATNADKISNPVSRKMQKISPKPKSLPVIIGSYKSTVTRESKIINPNFAWQSRFYEHIIRNEKSLNKIRQYIIDNPAKCMPAVALAKEGDIDRNNIENLWM